jgi:hypothetical protein
MMPKIKVNTFGEGIEIRQLQLAPATYELWSDIGSRKNRSFTDLLLDPFFYYDLKDPLFKELADINSAKVSGMLNTTKGHIEIWYNRHKVLKIQSHELFNKNVLFTLFNLEENRSFVSNKLEKGIYAVQKTIGLLSQQKLEIDDHRLYIDDFIFTVAEFDNNVFLTNNKYQQHNFNFIKSETVITNQFAFEIE